MENKENYFKILNAIDVNGKVEKKNGLTYLSWAWAWGEVKKFDPYANYKVYETLDGMNYFTDGKTGWVKTGVIVNGIEHIEYLPIMDYKNKSIPLEQITSFDVNKTIQRSLTKAVARHGLGLYIYAGEDLPEEAENKEVKQEDKQNIKANSKTSKTSEKPTMEATTEAYMKAVKRIESETEETPHVKDSDLPFELEEEKKINVLEQLQDAIADKCNKLNTNMLDMYAYYCRTFKKKSVDELNSEELMTICDKLDELIEKRGL